MSNGEKYSYNVILEHHHDTRHALLDKVVTQDCPLAIYLGTIAARPKKRRTAYTKLGRGPFLAPLQQHVFLLICFTFSYLELYRGGKPGCGCNLPGGAVLLSRFPGEFGSHFSPRVVQTQGPEPFLVSSCSSLSPHFYSGVHNIS